MFKQAEKSDLSQISLTGMRSLVLLGLLIQAPRSLEEIREAFINFNIMENSNSDDILRIDLNTLRAMGCEISRSSQKTDHKYVLIKHPYSLKLDKDEIDVLKRAFKKIKNKTDIETLILYDELFKKISTCLADSESKERVLGLCAMKSHNIERIRQFNDACKEKKILTLRYNSPVHNDKLTMEVATEKLVFKNDKIYIYGFDINKKESVTLNLKRILSVISQRDNDGNNQSSKVLIKFILKDFTVAGLEDNEKIIEKNDNGYLIEGNYHNEFVAMQRILSFGSSCVVLSPKEFKTKVIEILKKIKEIYDA